MIQSRHMAARAGHNRARDVINILISVVFVTAIGLAVTVTTSASAGYEFWIARLLYLIAAISVAVAYFVWIVTHRAESISTLLIGLVVAAIIVIGIPASFYWVDLRQQLTEPVSIDANITTYENAQLRQYTSLLAQRLRTFENSHDDELQSVNAKYDNDERERCFIYNDMKRLKNCMDKNLSERMAALMEVTMPYIDQYGKNFAPKIKALREEICTRIGMFPPFPPTGISLLDDQYGLGGMEHDPLSKVAFYLETLAKQLP
jgi:hypothetical protein